MGNTANAKKTLEEFPALSVETAKEYDFILCVDQSGSMGEDSLVLEGRTKWDEAQEFTEAFARFAEQSDDDGITLIKFSSDVRVVDGVKADQVHELFTKNRPHGGTNLAGALDAAFAKKFSSSKKAIILVVTDGAPDQPSAVQKSIIAATKKIENDSQINILIVQFGDDPAATKFLDSLDNGLNGAQFDVVNCLPAAAAGSLSMEQLAYQATNH
jgi:Mg-chelatase subunit ChlD